eukprot:SAG22_NODE_2000_length_3173_cov_2.355563_5_plen_134_part_00
MLTAARLCALQNTGRHATEADVFTHNFLTLDHQPPGPGTVVTVPFAITPGLDGHKLNASKAAIEGNKLVYLETVAGNDSVACPVAAGPRKAISDNQIVIESSRLGAGMKIVGDYQLAQVCVCVWCVCVCGGAL